MIETLARLFRYNISRRNTESSILDELENDSADLSRMRKDELFMAACKQAVKANRYLTPADISSLLAGLDQCVNSATCPHGRPLAIRISRSEIYKRFLRGGI